MKAPIEGHPNLYKDLQTGVIVNRESTDRERYRLAKRQSQMTHYSQHELAHLKSEIDEIKSLLHQLLNK